MEILNSYKKFVFVLIISFFLILFNKSYLYAGYGTGDLNISGKALEYFIQYIKNPGGKKFPRSSPMKFSVSLDGKNAWYYHCPAASSTQCRAGDKELNRKCEKTSYGSKCEIFAVGRSIKWKNGTAENIKIRFKSSDSRQEIIAKLSELNFVKKEEKKSKSIKKIDTSKKDLSTQLIEITELYKSGALSEEDYLKAKNKLLGK